MASVGRRIDLRKQATETAAKKPSRQQRAKFDPVDQ